LIRGKHRHGPWPFPTHENEHAARSRHDVCSPEAPQLAWAKAGPGATTDEGGGLVATLRRRLGIGEGEKQGDLTICVGGLGRARGDTSPAPAHVRGTLEARWHRFDFNVRRVGGLKGAWRTKGVR